MKRLQKNCGWKSLFHCGWNNLFQPVFGTTCPKLAKRITALVITFLCLLAPTSPAIIDTNTNGVSDLWEQQHNNGDLISNLNLQADPDFDGWTNEQEAAAGTDPFDSNPPNGFIRPKTIHVPALWGDDNGQPVILTPEVVAVTWPVISGKQYTLEFSHDLSAGSWHAIEEPYIANVAVPTYSFPTAEVEKCFWRVAVTDVDTDGDDLADAEEWKLGTNPSDSDTDGDGLQDKVELNGATDPKNADTDGDGVSDGDELLVHATNPLTSTDADVDGIPDDFEKHLAKLLLAYQPEAAYWGVYHVGLLAGNLDATHDYTGEGMNVRDLSVVLRKLPAAGASGSGIYVEPKTRRNKIEWAIYIPASGGNPERVDGVYWHSEPNGYGQRSAISSHADCTPAYLTGRIGQVEWGAPLIWDLISIDLFSLLAIEASAGFLVTPVNPVGTRHRGFISESRFRLVASRPDHESYSVKLMKITSKHKYLDRIGNGEILSAEAVTVDLPKGKFLSGWQEYSAPMVTGQETVVSFLPIEVSVPASVIHDRGVAANTPKPQVVYKDATELKIATWENSFQHIDPEALVHWWVLNDDDHVKIRIPRPDKIGQGPIKVSIESTNPPEYAGVFDDLANEVNLTESATEPGIFEYTFLLVSNNVDDAWGGVDEGLDDTTHKITVGGELIIKYEDNEISRLKVKEKGRIKLRPLVLWYSGGNNGTPAVPDSVVLDDVRDIRRRFAQAGIAVEWDYAAWGIDVNNVPGASDHFRSNGMETLNGTAASGDEVALSNYITTAYPGIGAKEILMIYSSKIWAPSNFGGLTEVDPKAYTLIPSLASTLGVRPMIITSAQRSLHTMAHETLHMLLDDVHPDATTGKHDVEFRFDRRLWSGGPNQNEVTDRVRMSKTVVDDVQKSPLITP